MQLLTKARYRGLRGIVRHVLPAVRKGWTYTVRDGVPGGVPPLRNRIKAVCWWCGLPTDDARRLRWHPDCYRYYACARSKGATVDFSYNYVIQPTGCYLCGKPSSELDHRVALSIAARRGPRAHARAFLPENLQWLCHECHMEKTRTDRRILANLNAGRPEDYVSPPPGPKPPTVHPDQMALQLPNA